MSILAQEWADYEAANRKAADEYQRVVSGRGYTCQVCGQIRGSRSDRYCSSECLQYELAGGVG